MYVVYLDNDIIITEGCRRDGLFVRVLAMNNARRPGFAMSVHSVPYLAHPGTRRVYYLHFSITNTNHTIGTNRWFNKNFRPIPLANRIEHSEPENSLLQTHCKLITRVN